jgi:hypothetical protein
MPFLQGLLQKNKRYLDERECRRPPKLPKLAEFSTKVLVKSYVPKKLQELYMPTKAEKCDRNFVYTLWATMCPDAADSYYEQILSRMSKPTPPKSTTIDISEDWLNMLLQYNHKRRY